MRRTYVELEEDPLLGVGGSGPVSSKVSVEDVNGLLGGGFPGGGLDFVGQGLHPRLQLYLHIPLSLSVLLPQLLNTPSFQIEELG